MSPPSCASRFEEKTVRMRLKKKENKAAHFAERNSDQQRPHFGQVACQTGRLRRLVPRQKSQGYHGEERADCVMGKDVAADEDIEGKPRDEKSAVMIVSVWEKRRNAGSLEGMRVLRGVLGCMQDGLALGAAAGAANENCSSWP
jgi:hypothetical protein